MPECDSSGNTINKAYVWGPTGLNTCVTNPTGGAPSILGYAFDPSGNVVNRVQYISSGDTSVVTSQIYQAYGTRVQFSGTDGDPIAYKGQSGCYTDTEIAAPYQLVYCHNRTYCPYIGRWLSRDPTGAEGGMNVYEFCGNNPLMFSDPSGLMFTHGAASGERGPGGGYCETDGYLSNVGGVFGGYGSALLDTGEGIVLDNPTSPWGMYKNLESSIRMAQNPDAAYKGMCQGIGKAWGDFTANGSPQEFGQIWGKVLIAAGSAAAGGAETAVGGEYCVYQALDEEGNVCYIGMTKDILRRTAEHLRGPRKLRIDAIDELTDLSYADARGAEQALIENYGLAKNGGTLLNKINSIARTNPNYEIWVAKGRSLANLPGRT